jgi:GrpB-like predicted nucleotidyltransferase (UPF0157 family)
MHSAKEGTGKSDIGLDHNAVKLSPYSSQWLHLYKSEKALLEETLKDLVIAVEHIGSTAVPGMTAKPIIDIAACVKDRAALDACMRPLAAAGYAYKGEYGLPGRYFFIKGEPSTHHLHVVLEGSYHWKSWITFRDYVSKHDNVAQEYAALKTVLAERYANDRPSYTKAKGRFISDVLDRIDPGREDRGK